MSLHFLLTENLRDPLNPLLDSIIQRHIFHRLSDDFLILTPNFESSQDLIHYFLQDQRLGGVLTGSSILSVDEWVREQARRVISQSSNSPYWIRELTFRSLLKEISFPTEELKNNFLKNDSSFKTLFGLIQSFRDELLIEKDLYSFVSQFDPLLAQICSELFVRYEERLRSYPFLGDEASETETILKTILKKELSSLQSIKTIYWIGFPFLSSIHRKLIEAIEAQTKIEQIILLQIGRKKEPQDLLSLYWGEAIPPFSEFKNPNQSSAEKNLFNFSTPFEEAGFILSKISQLVKEGISPDLLAVFLSGDPFWKFYFSRELEKMGVFANILTQKSLLSFSSVANNVGADISESIEKTEQTVQEKQKLFSRTQSKDIALEIKALGEWLELLERILFYKKELKFLEKESFPLKKIAGQTLLKERSVSHQGISLRGFSEAGLKNFHTVFLFNFSDRSLPETAERFFGFPLPDSRKNPSVQKALFQHLLFSASQSIYLTHSNSTSQGEENSISSFAAEFELGKSESKSCFPIFISTKESVDFQKRLRMEISKEKGGMIRSKKIIQLLQKRISDHIYTPRQFEEYAICPFRFLTSILFKIESPLEQLIDGSPAERGTWIHDFLEDFFSRFSKEISKAGQDPSLQQSIFLKLEKELKSFSLKFLKDKPWIDETLSIDFMEKSIRMIQNLIQDFWARNNQAEKYLIPTFFEVKFDEENGKLLILEKENLPPLKIRGRIDRIDLTEDQEGFVVFDYKTGKAGETTKQIQQLKSFQLPLYLLAAEKIVADKTGKKIEGRGALILDLKEMKMNQGLLQKEMGQNLGLSNRSNALLNEKSWNEYWLKLKEKLLSLHEKIYAGDFRVKPDPCDPFCHSRTICRYYDRARIDS